MCPNDFVRNKNSNNIFEEAPLLPDIVPIPREGSWKNRDICGPPPVGGVKDVPGP